MKRKLILAAAGLTALELAFDALILLAFLPLERQDAIGAALSLAPVLAISSLSWLLAPVRWLRGMSGELGLEHARLAVLRYPRRTLVYRSMGVGVLGLALAPTLAGLFGVGTEAAFVIAGTIATVGFVTNVARAGAYRRILSPLAETHWAQEPSRYQALCLRERLVVATVMVGTVGVIAAGLFVRYVVGVPAPDLAVAALAAPAVIAITLSLHCLDLWLSTAPLVAFLAGDKKPAASDALRIASAVPYRSAASSFLGWVCFALVAALVHRARGGLGSEALQMFAGVAAVGIGLLPYQLAWHRHVLEQVRAAAATSIVAGELSPARSRLSIRGKLVAAFVALIGFGGTFAALGTFGEHDRFLAAAAGAEAAHRRDTLLDGLGGERVKAAAADPDRLRQLARELSGPQARVLALVDGQVLGEPDLVLPPRLTQAIRQGEPAYGPVPRLRASFASRPVGASSALGVLRPWRDRGQQDIVPLLFVFAALGLASAGLVLIAVQELTGPLRALSAGARRMGAGDLSGPIAPPDSDEMGELAAAMEWARRELSSKVRSIEELNASLEQRVKDRTAALEKANGELATTLAQLQAARAEVVHAEKMASLGRLVAGIAHEINNPLNFVQNGLAPLKTALGQLSQLASLCPKPGASEAELLAAAKSASDLRAEGLDGTVQDVEALLRVMGNGVTRMGAIVRALRDFSRQSASEAPEPVELERLVDDAAALLRHDLKGRVELVKKLGPTGPVLCQPGPLTQVFLNLLKNAAQAMDGPGLITVSSAPVDGGVEIRVADTGKGIAAEDLPKIFEPFYTTKAVGEGTGLGLAIVHGIVEKHRGRIGCSSRPGQGTEFTIFLPQAPTPTSEAASGA